MIISTDPVTGETVIKQPGHQDVRLPQNSNFVVKSNGGSNVVSISNGNTNSVNVKPYWQKHPWQTFEGQEHPWQKHIWQKHPWQTFEGQEHPWQTYKGETQPECNQDSTVIYITYN
ncbi:hypothetical protein [Scale drop disease virus]|uniref:Uncharacterized protein n=1 Tax=Scale drop disease virus TaxID=1697349 RepID=A0A7D5UL14_9VIRU|nr:hypothetical protein [Scale drop disease virus]QXJ13646.1 ORF058R [Scale drop disease virus]